MKLVYLRFEYNITFRPVVFGCRGVHFFDTLLTKIIYLTQTWSVLIHFNERAITIQVHIIIFENICNN